MNVKTRILSSALYVVLVILFSNNANADNTLEQSSIIQETCDPHGSIECYSSVVNKIATLLFKTGSTEPKTEETTFTDTLNHVCTQIATARYSGDPSGVSSGNVTITCVDDFSGSVHQVSEAHVSLKLPENQYSLDFNKDKLFNVLSFTINGEDKLNQAFLNDYKQIHSDGSNSTSGYLSQKNATDLVNDPYSDGSLLYNYVSGSNSTGDFSVGTNGLNTNSTMNSIQGSTQIDSSIGASVNDGNMFSGGNSSIYGQVSNVYREPSNSSTTVIESRLPYYDYIENQIIPTGSFNGQLAAGMTEAAQGTLNNKNNVSVDFNTKYEFDQPGSQNGYTYSSNSIEGLKPVNEEVIIPKRAYVTGGSSDFEVPRTAVNEEVIVPKRAYVTGGSSDFEVPRTAVNEEVVIPKKAFITRNGNFGALDAVVNKEVNIPEKVHVTSGSDYELSGSIANNATPALESNVSEGSFFRNIFNGDSYVPKLSSYLKNSYKNVTDTPNNNPAFTKGIGEFKSEIGSQISGITAYPKKNVLSYIGLREDDGNGQGEYTIITEPSKNTLAENSTVYTTRTVSSSSPSLDLGNLQLDYTTPTSVTIVNGMDTSIIRVGTPTIYKSSPTTLSTVYTTSYTTHLSPNLVESAPSTFIKTYTSSHTTSLPPQIVKSEPFTFSTTYQSSYVTSLPEQLSHVTPSIYSTTYAFNPTEVTSNRLEIPPLTQKANSTTFYTSDIEKQKSGADNRSALEQSNNVNATKSLVFSNRIMKSQDGSTEGNVLKSIVPREDISLIGNGFQTYNILGGQQLQNQRIVYVKPDINPVVTNNSAIVPRQTYVIPGHLGASRYDTNIGTSLVNSGIIPTSEKHAILEPVAQFAGDNILITSNSTPLGAANGSYINDASPLPLLFVNSVQPVVRGVITAEETVQPEVRITNEPIVIHHTVTPTATITSEPKIVSPIREIQVVEKPIIQTFTSTILLKETPTTVREIHQFTSTTVSTATSYTTSTVYSTATTYVTFTPKPEPHTVLTFVSSATPSTQIIRSTPTTNVHIISGSPTTKFYKHSPVTQVTVVSASPHVRVISSPPVTYTHVKVVSAPPTIFITSNPPVTRTYVTKYSDHTEIIRPADATHVSVVSQSPTTKVLNGESKTEIKVILKGKSSITPSFLNTLIHADSKISETPRSMIVTGNQERVNQLVPLASSDVNIIPNIPVINSQDTTEVYKVPQEQSTDIDTINNGTVISADLSVNSQIPLSSEEQKSNGTTIVPIELENRGMLQDNTAKIEVADLTVPFQTVNPSNSIDRHTHSISANSTIGGNDVPIRTLQELSEVSIPRVQTAVTHVQVPISEQLNFSAEQPTLINADTLINPDESINSESSYSIAQDVPLRTTVEGIQNLILTPSNNVDEYQVSTPAKYSSSNSEISDVQTALPQSDQTIVNNLPQENKENTVVSATTSPGSHSISNDMDKLLPRVTEKAEINDCPPGSVCPQVIYLNCDELGIPLGLKNLSNKKQEEVNHKLTLPETYPELQVVPVANNEEKGVDTNTQPENITVDNNSTDQSSIKSNISIPEELSLPGVALGTHNSTINIASSATQTISEPTKIDTMTLPTLIKPKVDNESIPTTIGDLELFNILRPAVSENPGTPNETKTQDTVMQNVMQNNTNAQNPVETMDSIKSTSSKYNPSYLNINSDENASLNKVYRNGYTRNTSTKSKKSTSTYSTKKYGSSLINSTLGQSDSYNPTILSSYKKKVTDKKTSTVKDQHQYFHEE